MFVLFSPHRNTAYKTEACQSRWHHSRWCPHRTVRVRFLNPCSWLSYAILLQFKKGSKIVVIPSFSVDPSAPISRPQCVLFSLELTRDRWLNVRQFTCTISWNAVCCSICCWNKWPENLDLRKFPLWGKEPCYRNETLLWRQRVTESPLQRWGGMA